MANKKTMAKESRDSLLQLFHGVTWDGDVISPSTCKELREDGFSSRYEGWNFITAEGVEFLHDEGLVSSEYDGYKPLVGG